MRFDVEIPPPAAPTARPPQPIDLARVAEVLSTDVSATQILGKGKTPIPGTLIGVRLNLNVLKNTGVAVQTLHAATNRSGYRRNQGFYTGEAIGYAAAVTLRNAYFNVHQASREAIAQGKSAKMRMASVDGELLRLDTVADCDGVEIRFNPKTTHLFIDQHGRAVQFAEEVTIVGHRAYARGLVLYHTMATAPARAGDAPSEAWVPPAEAPSITPSHASPRSTRAMD